MIVGAKSQVQGIEVINVHVKGDEGKPSNVERLDSTADELRTINIETHENYREGDSFADLTIREGSTGNLDRHRRGRFPRRPDPWFRNVFQECGRDHGEGWR